MGLKSEQCSKIVSTNYFVKKRVLDIGISRKYIAYYYLVDILDYLINNDCEIRSFSREVYPELAKKYEKSDFTVERDIRNVIKLFWGTIKQKLLTFWSADRRPSCCKFIVLLRDYILSEIVL